MIISGYPAIGKSTLAHLAQYRVIDLESSDFVVNGNRIEDWCEIYCKIAIRLSSQGYIVFVSCHGQVRDYLKENGVDYYVIHPSLKLKNEWLNKLEERFKHSKDPKDRRALEYAKKFYDVDIMKIADNETNRIEIDKIDYHLEKLIEKAIELHDGKN